MASIRARVAALEHYRHKSDPGGVGLVFPDDGGGWRAEYAGKSTTFPTQEQAIHHIDAQAARDIPVIIFDI